MMPIEILQRILEFSGTYFEKKKSSFFSNEMMVKIEMKGDSINQLCVFFSKQLFKKLMCLHLL